MKQISSGLLCISVMYNCAIPIAKKKNENSIKQTIKMYQHYKNSYKISNTNHIFEIDVG